MSFFRKTAVCLSVASIFFAVNTHAATCVDPTGNALQIKEMLASASRWVDEKSKWASQIAQDKALAEYQNLQDSYRTSATISAITTSVSSTENAHAEERYATSPSACSTMRGAKALLDSWSGLNSCNSEELLEKTELAYSKIRDCQNGSGLHCDKLKDKREEISSRLVQAVKTQDGETLSTMLDGATVLGIGSGVMSPENDQKHADALALLLGVNDTPNLPRSLDGTLANPDDPHAINRTTEWASNLTVNSIADAALLEVHDLYRHKDGKKSIMAQLEERVKYFNSEEFIKLITNTNDKSQLPSDWDTMHPEAKFAYLSTLPVDQQIVSSEQVARMQAEMMSLLLPLMYLNTKANVTNVSLVALQNKELSK